ncbi:MAG: hypothetical protein AMK73_03580, partial [Planctomycetes bacterium SM23_32]
MSSRAKRAFFLTLAVALLFASGMALRPLQDMRSEYDLSNQPVEGLSPQLALATQMLGWGRGLIIDVIWIRMESLKQHDRYFELVQLADWACKLAPRFPEVWDIQSWNLAYNVSCRLSYLPDRWTWVHSGIELLRDYGIPLNPFSSMLYERLAWTYFHKIGEQDDQAHFFYKQRFGLLMHEVLGGEGDRQILEAYAAAPRTKEELLRDPQVQALWTECKALGFDIVDGFFEWYKITPSVPGPVYQALNRVPTIEPLKRIAVYARARRLREEYKLDPRKMLAVAEQFPNDKGEPAPFDWRTPYPHAIYWAAAGLEKLDELEDRTWQKFGRFSIVPKFADTEKEPWREEDKLFEFRRINLQRVIYASMQSLVAHGRLLFDTKGRLMLEVGTDYRFADATLPLYKQTMEGHAERFQSGIRDAYRNFLRRGVIEFYLMGDVKKSMEYFNILIKEFPNEAAGLTYDEYRRFRMKWNSRDMTTGQARTLVAGLLVQGFFALGCNAEDKAAVFEAEAKGRVAEWNADAVQSLRGTVRYNNLREAVLIDILTGRARFPEDVRAVLEKRLTERTGDEAIQRILHNVRAAQQG